MPRFEVYRDCARALVRALIYTLDRRVEYTKDWDDTSRDTSSFVWGSGNGRDEGCKYIYDQGAAKILTRQQTRDSHLIRPRPRND